MLKNKNTKDHLFQIKDLQKNGFKLESYATLWNDILMKEIILININGDEDSEGNVYILNEYEFTKNIPIESKFLTKVDMELFISDLKSRMTH